MNVLHRPVSLTSRLVATAVALVAVVSVLIGAATWLAMRSSLTGQLDDEVMAALARAERGPSEGGPPPFREEDRDDHHEGGLYDVRGQGVGTLTVFLEQGVGGVITGGDRGLASGEPLTDEALEELAELPADGAVHQVSLPDLGRYRVAVDDDGDVAAGLPTSEIDRSLGYLLLIEAVLVALAVLAAGGAGLYLVRRQLRPLREVAGTADRVAELPLGSGEVAVGERVPARLTDGRTEVGQVGAALNTLLDHVESALAARHRSEQQVRQFVADASHELRTPLATIRGYAELAGRRPDDPEAVARALARVSVESTRMAALVEDLLLLARLDAGRPLAQEPVDLTRLLLEAVADARVLGPDHEWRLELPDEPIEVVGDEHRLHQVVSNLLANARRYTPASTTVTVSADAAGFTVHDDGPGFDPGLAGSAFERFSRGDPARTREHGGVGLGLALVRAIVSAHGGSVGLRSHPGDTALRVDLPVG